MKIKEYLTNNELSCRCGCGTMPDIRSIEQLYAIRFIIQSPIYLNCGARCLAHNKAVGGKRGSIHLPPIDREGRSAMWGGCGFDIRDKTWLDAGLSALELIEIARLVGFRGFGYKKTFLHIDDARRTQLDLWGY